MVEDAITSDEDESDDEGRYGGDPMMKDGMVEDDITSDEDESDAEHDGMQLEHNRDGDELLVAGKLMEDAAYGGAMFAQGSPADINECSTEKGCTIQRIK
ncbi:hypothetical protein L2E82_04230 [Cichorium intybus]|uniref:Uncharacterized protein n=1 Tax=Cichorium intybus TaxID=13427 RepID=A0ACB9H5Q6_CICIN|nr:hypothetical protein L2E82_04230 [Cichorium intybus]